MAHRIRSLVESLHKKGQCPRLKLDTTREGVDCPDFIREQWKHEMVVDLDLSWPLELEFTESGIEANLAFSGYVYRCVMPWHAIYIVTSREDPKEFTLIEEHIPPELASKLGVGPRPEYAGDINKLAKANKRPGDRRRRRRGHSAAATTDSEGPFDEGAEPPSERPVLGIVRDEQASSEPASAESQKEETETLDEDTPDKETVSDLEAKRRRSIFKVIDGGSD